MLGEDVDIVEIDVEGVSSSFLESESAARGGSSSSESEVDAEFFLRLDMDGEDRATTKR